MHAASVTSHFTLNPGIPSQAGYCEWLHSGNEAGAWRTAAGQDRQARTGPACRSMKGLLLQAYLVGGAHASVEDVQGHTHQSGVGHPGAIVPSPHLPLLVRLHLRSHLPDQAQ